MTSIITDVDAIGLTAPLEEPFGYSLEWVTERIAALVRIKASDGIIG